MPYELSSLVADLVLLARYLLKPRGRLVFFLPTVTDEYEELDIQTMLCDGMEVVANSLQNFGTWGRRVRPSYIVLPQSNLMIAGPQLITIRKTTTERYPPPTFAPPLDEPVDGQTHTPAHKDFREKYFQRFGKLRPELEQPESEGHNDSVTKTEIYESENYTAKEQRNVGVRNNE